MLHPTTLIGMVSVVLLVGLTLGAFAWSLVEELKEKKRMLRKNQN